MTIALIGNQNSGKTTLFNQLTGNNQRVGNFPGVTVEKKEGIVKKHRDITVVDLPGIYSLSPYTPEEVVTRDFLIYEKPDAVINIVDATNIERSLYLTLQVIELNIPMVLALNMMDEIRSSGISIDVEQLSETLGISVIPISASKNEGIEDLIKSAKIAALQKSGPKKLDFCKGETHRAIHAVAYLIGEQAEKAGIPSRFAATKLIEGDEPMLKALKLSKSELDVLWHIVDEMEKKLGTDREAALADMRYDYIEQICKAAVHRSGETKEQLRSLKIDSILTNKYLAIPIFLAIMMTVFGLMFGVIGSGLNDLFSLGIDFVISVFDSLLSGLGVNKVIRSLLIDGVFAGVGSVLSFLPTIVILFFFLSILEDSGYMARVAFVMDKLLRKIGLSGRSFVPMLIGFGCSVPAIMATRSLSSERDKKMTILLIPFMSCNAKLPIYALFTAAFFPEHGALVMISLYIMGMLLAIISGLLLKNTVFKGNCAPFVLELPSYRLPPLKIVFLHLWNKAKDFIQRAFTIIFMATIAIWVFQTFDLRFNMVEDSSKSILAIIGKTLAPFFVPLGFGDWKAVSSLITGFTAKEAVVSTLAVLTGANTTSLMSELAKIFTPLSALSFLTFTLLYTPCSAAIAAVKREFKSARAALAVVVYQTAVAWMVSFLVYNAGRILGF